MFKPILVQRWATHILPSFTFTLILWIFAQNYTAINWQQKKNSHQKFNFIKAKQMQRKKYSLRWLCPSSSIPMFYLIFIVFIWLVSINLFMECFMLNHGTGRIYAHFIIAAELN